MKTLNNKSVAVLLALALLAGLQGGVVAEDRLPPALEIVHSGIAHDAVFALEINGQDGIAVGHHGLALTSADSGKSWTPMSGLGTDAALLGVSRSGSRGLIVGQQGLILRTEDGSSWNRVDSGTDSRLLAVKLNDDGHAYIAGAFGLLLHSSDHGATWEQISITFDDYIDEPGYEPHLYDVFIQPDGRVFVVGEFGMIISSTDNGQTWTSHNRGDESVFDLHLTPGGKGYAVGQNGLILRSVDAGLSWERLNSPTEGNLFGVWGSDFDEVVVAGIRNLLRSSDGGANWRQGEDANITRSWYQAIATGETTVDMGRGEITQEVVYIGGNYGVIARVAE